MPNWCSNSLRISGKQKHIDAFTARVGGTFSFETFAPMPAVMENIAFDRQQQAGSESGFCHLVAGKGEDGNDQTIRVPVSVEEAEQLKERYGAVGWYQWRVRHWGTKWDACRPNVSTYPGSVFITFDTAWAPSETIVDRISTMFPKLTFVHAFAEQNMGFYGWSKYHGGIQIDYQNFEEEFYEECDELEDTLELTDRVCEFLQTHGLHTGG